jgi:sarcosine oxidase subunit gamma
LGGGCWGSGFEGRTAGVDAVLWLSPDEFLVVGGVASVVLGSFGSGVDVSAARAGVDVSGARARELLSTGCSLDLHPEVFLVDHCAQTLLARANVLIWRYRRDAYRVLTGTSFAGYLVDRLADAAAEYR